MYFLTSKRLEWSFIITLNDLSFRMTGKVVQSFSRYDITCLSNAVKKKLQMRLSEERKTVVSIERNNMITNNAQTTEAANEDEMLAGNVSLMAEDIRKSVGHLNRLIQSSLVSSSNNVLEMEMLHEKIKDFISVMDPNSGSRIQRR